MKDRENGMKDLTRFYMALASSLERTWTPQADKRHAAILLRNHAIETPHCHFCGNDSEAHLYESRYNPKARICKLCAYDIASTFAASAASPEPKELYRRDATIGPPRSFQATTAIDYRRGTVVEELTIADLETRAPSEQTLQPPIPDPSD